VTTASLVGLIAICFVCDSRTVLLSHDPDGMRGRFFCPAATEPVSPRPQKKQAASLFSVIQPAFLVFIYL